MLVYHWGLYRYDPLGKGQDDVHMQQGGLKLLLEGR